MLLRRMQTNFAAAQQTTSALSSWCTVVCLVSLPLKGAPFHLPSDALAEQLPAATQQAQQPADGACHKGSLASSCLDEQMRSAGSQHHLQATASFWPRQLSPAAAAPPPT